MAVMPAITYDIGKKWLMWLAKENLKAYPEHQVNTYPKI